ncbi:translation initiation factor IF-2-like [Falco peregrinus]|uniref:translation initiation factor IF-2-like n=1 Tax=Falco peregrinus TaxID=8954 RepID=UPI002478DE4A|nr:translation initiation factor IF-2-like [Falco peregrinus]
MAAGGARPAGGGEHGARCSRRPPPSAPADHLSARAPVQVRAGARPLRRWQGCAELRRNPPFPRRGREEKKKKNSHAPSPNPGGHKASVYSSLTDLEGRGRGRETKIKHNLRERKRAPALPGATALAAAEPLSGAAAAPGTGRSPPRPGPAAATFPPAGSFWCGWRLGLLGGGAASPARRGCGGVGVRERWGPRGCCGGWGGGRKWVLGEGVSSPFGGPARAACVAGRGSRPAGLGAPPPRRSPTLFPRSAGRGERRGGRGSISRGLRMPDRPAGGGRRENIKKRKEFGVSLRNRRNKTLS